MKMAAAIPSLAALLAMGCGDSTGSGGTAHVGWIRSNETWTRDGSPHVVRGRLFVGDGAGVTLTIEPGATVVFDPGASLLFGVRGPGTLLAQGTAAAPIRFQAADTTGPAPSWVGLVFRSNTISQMSHVTLSDCGGVRSDSQPRGCIVLGHAVFRSERSTLRIDDVTVRNAAGVALILLGASGFGEGSATFSAHNMRGHIATLPADVAGDFPVGGTFTG